MIEIKKTKILTRILFLVVLSILILGGVSVYSLISMSSIGMELKEETSNLLLIAIIGGVILLLTSIFIIRSISYPIKGISLQIEIAEREADLTRQFNQNTTYEIGSLAGDLNRFFGSFRNIVQNIKLSANTIAKIKDSLAASAEETSATIGNIKNSTSSLLKESEKMNRNVTDNVTSIEQITTNINSINSQISDQAAMVEESTASITEIMSSLDSMNNITMKKGEAVDKLVEIAGSGSSTLTVMAEGFRTGVVDKIEGISEMASTIQQIASQTNLLSMNAAIEAAHAGDAGKGFAVVADEIRKLADTSSQSSAKITRILKEISDGVLDTEIKTKESSEAFDVINREIKETKQAFDEIASSTQELNVGGKLILDAMSMLQDVTTNIKGASEEMIIGSKQVVRSQLELKDISDQVTKGMQEISSGSEEIVIASDEIVKYSSELNSVVNDLKEETDKFKT